MRTRRVALHGCSSTGINRADTSHASISVSTAHEALLRTQQQQYLSQPSEHICDLTAELSGGRDDEGPGAVPPLHGGGEGHEVVQQGDQIGEGLAGSCGCR